MEGGEGVIVAWKADKHELRVVRVEDPLPEDGGDETGFRLQIEVAGQEWESQPVAGAVYDRIEIAAGAVDEDELLRGRVVPLRAGAFVDLQVPEIVAHLSMGMVAHRSRDGAKLNALHGDVLAGVAVADD